MQHLHKCQYPKVETVAKAEYITLTIYHADVEKNIIRKPGIL